MAILFRELRFAWRQLLKSPAFTLTAVLTLAFGIGASTAIFSIVEGVLLRPLPFASPSGLVTFGDTLEGAGKDALPGLLVTAPEAITYAKELRSFSSLGAYRQTVYELSSAGEPVQINASRLTAGVLQALGVPAILGRTFTQQEDQTKQQVAILSYQLWRDRFHGDRKILGRKLMLDRKPYEIIGVMPREFEFPLVPGRLNRSDLWVPMSFSPEGLADSSNWNYQMVGRLKPGVTIPQAKSEAAHVAEQIMRNFPPAMASLRIHPGIESLDQSTVSEASPLVRTLFFVVLLVLLVACANLAGLLLLRVTRRQRETAVRIALGAGKTSVLAQTLMEMLLLCGAGGLLGLGLATEVLQIGIAFLPESLPRISSVKLDWQVVGFSLALALVTAVLCGIVPALAASRTDVNEALKEGGRTATPGSGYARLRSILVTAELAVALVLLTASGLLLRSFEKLCHVEIGLRADHVLTAAYQLPTKQYSAQAAVDLFNKALLTKLSQIPGVESAGITSTLPAAGQNNTGSFLVEGFAPPKGAELTVSWPSWVIGSYFRAAGISIVQGREFTDADRAGAPLVVIVNRTLAERYWPKQNPIGKRLHWGVRDTPLPWMTVVGEIGDVKQSAADIPTRDQIYQPASQQKLSYGTFAPAEMLNANSGYVVLRTALPPEQMEAVLLATVRSIDPQLPLTQIASMERVIDEGRAPRRFNATLSSTFAVAALLIAVLGIYSVISFSSALRTHEMAIRLALGSQRKSVMALIFTSAAKLAAVGCGIGVVGSLFVGRLMRSFLFQVDPLDISVLGLAFMLMFLLAMAASLIPALRAASTDPASALHAN